MSRLLFLHSTSVFFALASSLSFDISVAFAQPPVPAGGISGSNVQPAPSNSPEGYNAAPSATQGDMSLATLSVAPKNLMEMHLHPASFPGEAEFRCGVLEPCAVGVVRGFTLGSDAFAMLYAPLYGPVRSPGKWLHFDGFVGFQFLDNVDGKANLNGYVGYKTFSFEDSQNRKVSARGFTFRLAYGQAITPIYTQGLVFQGFVSQHSYNRESNMYQLGREGDETRKTLNKFYEFSQKYPKVRIGFPIDLEVINWKNTHIDLPNHLRGYLNLEPFYTQNTFEIENWVSLVEKNFGGRLGVSMAYESASVKSGGRWSVLGSVGGEIATFDTRFASKGKTVAQGTRPEYPRRKTLDYYVNVTAGYQF